MLKREGADVNTFASSIRLQRKLEQKGLNEEQVESFVENIDIHCFKHGLKPEQFIDILNKVCTISDNLGIPVHEMPEYTRQEEERLKEIKQDINDLQPSTVSCPIFNTYRLIYDNKLVLNKRSILFKQMIICL